jgi:hypothetical protein
MRDAISRLVAACCSDHPPDQCPMLAALDEADKNRTDSPD